MKTANEILQLINRYIDEMPYNRQPASLYEPIRYILSLGGKRIRPTLMMLAYNLYQEDPASIRRILKVSCRRLVVWKPIIISPYCTMI